MHPPSRAYIDPWTGELFGEGGVEKMFHAQPITNVATGGSEGGVIMTKLGNETAKLALLPFVSKLRD